MPVSSGDKLCPICDSPLQPGSKKCGFCGTDLSIFDIDVEEPKKAAAPVPQEQSARTRLESRVDEVLSRPPARESPSPRSLDRIPSFTPPAKSREPLKPAVIPEARPEPSPAPAPAKEVEVTPPVSPVGRASSDETFECPECGARVGVSASSCPKCGVIFAEEGGDLFQCPACNVLVNVDAKTCPGCGAMFVESEEAAEATPVEPTQPAVAVPAPAQMPGPAPAIKDIEPPLSEVEEKPAAKPARKDEREADQEPAKGMKERFGGLFKRKKREEPEARGPSKPEKVEEGPEETVEIAGIAASPSTLPTHTRVPAHKPAVHEAGPVRPAPVKEPASVITPTAAASQAAPVQTDTRDKGKELARMVAEIKPLLALAMEKEVDIGESKQLIDEAAVAGRERQLESALELVKRSKSMLMDKVDVHLTVQLGQLRDELAVARELGGDVSRPETYLGEIEKAKASGDVEAAYVYADKVQKELLPITGRYNESKKKLTSLKALIADCEVFIVDTKEPRGLLVEANNAFEARDFNSAEIIVKRAEEKLYKAIPTRMNDEMRKAKDQLVEAKVKNVNITPMITVLKSATNLMKAGDYRQAMREMREFREMMRKVL